MGRWEMGILIRLSLFGHTWGYSLSTMEKQADSKYVYDYFFMFSTWFFEKKLSWKDHIPFGIVSIGESCTWLNVYVRTFYCTDLTEWLIVIKLIHQKFLVINIISYHTLLPVGYIFIPFTVFANHSFSRNMSTRRYTLWQIGL